MPRPRRTLLASALLAACAICAGCARDSEADAAAAARRADADIETLPSPEAGVGSVTGMPKPGDPGARRQATAVAIGDDEYTAEVAEVEAGSEARLAQAEADTEAAVDDASETDAGAEVAADAGDLPLPPPAQPQAVVVPLERKQPLPPPPPASPPPPPTSAPLPPPPPEAGDEPAAQ